MQFQGAWLYVGNHKIWNIRKNVQESPRETQFKATFGDRFGNVGKKFS